MKKITAAISIILGLGLIGSQVALANHADSMADVERDMALARQQSNLIRIAGNLTCSQGAENTGEGCILQITDQASGKIFNLTNINSAMELYLSGKKNVAIRGELVGNGTLQIHSVKSL